MGARFDRPALLAGASLLVLAVANPVQAQTAGSSNVASGPQPVGLEEVVVTAQRRSERLQEVPISVQVVTGQSVQQRNLTSLESLSQVVPSLTATKGGATNFLLIRGIGSGGSQAFDQSVATFIDDIYHGRSRSSSATFLDLDRVEVLKGPQSTFFGNNAIAGALNIVSKKPSDTFEGWARALYGENNQFALEGAVNAPINDKLAVRIAGTYNGTDGFMKNVTTGEDVPRERNYAGRITLGFKPTDDFDATLKIEAGGNHQKGDLHLQVVNCPPPAPFTAGAFCNSAIAQNVPRDFGDRTGESPGGRVDLTTAESVLTLNYEKWDHRFTSVTGFSSYRYRQNLDLDATPQVLATNYAPENYHQFSQELRVASPTGGTIEYLAGAYFQTDKLRYAQDGAQPFRNGSVLSTASLAGLIPFLPLGQAIRFNQNEDVYSVFGSLTWNATDKIKLSAGLRGSWVKKSFTRDLFYAQATQDFGGLVALPASVANLPIVFFGATPGTLTGDRTDNAWMPSFKAQYQFTPNAMAYASYSRGFKAGGFNGSDATGLMANVPFDPEYVDSYEVGVKSEWLDKRLLLNLTAFRGEYSNLQVTVREGYLTGPGFAVVRNAASSVSQGAEFESRWLVAPQFQIGANITYLDSHYVSFPNATANSALTVQGAKFQDLSGSPTAYSAKWTGSVTGAYTIDLPSAYQLTAEVSPFFSSAYYVLPAEDPAKQGSYVRWDTRLSLQSPGDRWSIDLIGKNLTDKQVLGFGTIMPTAVGTYMLSKQEGRTIAAQFRVRW